jgi:hypothetical protein
VIHKVLTIHEAEEDVFDIYRHILLNTSANAAEQVLGRIEEASGRPEKFLYSLEFSADCVAISD